MAETVANATNEEKGQDERALAIQEEKEKRAFSREVLRDSPSMFLNVVKFEHAQRVGRVLGSSSMVPQHFRGEEGLGNIMIALNLADRLQVDVFMLMQSMYVVHGRPGLEGKLVVALINQSGLFDGPLQWRFDGTKNQDGWSCTAYAKHRKTGETLELTIEWATVKGMGWYDKKGPDGSVSSNMWRNMPEQMFRYRTASWFANAYCPEVKMAMPTTDELRDTVDLRPGLNGTFSADESTKGPSLKDRLSQAKNQPQEAPQEQTQPEAPAEPQEAHGEEQEPEFVPFRERWINLRAAGFSTFVFKNLDRFRAADPKDQAEAREKWLKLYGESPDPWPLDKEKAAEPNAPKPNGDHPAIYCPRKESRVFIDVCEASNCGEWADCKPYREFKGAQAPTTETIACPEKDGEERPIADCEGCGIRADCPAYYDDIPQ